MHIPDGFLSPPLWAALDAAAAGVVTYAVLRVEEEFDAEDMQLPLMGVTAAFIFTAQMFNFPVTGGTSGHLLGGVLATALLGPWRAVLVMTAVFLVQALMFGDGGVLALGANVLNMGVVGCFVGHVLLRGLWHLSGGQVWGRQVGLALAAWLSVEAGAVLTAVELAASGRIPLDVVLPAMAAVHALIGIGEAIITVAAVNLIGAVRPDLTVTPDQAGSSTPQGRPNWWRLGLALLLALALVPFASSLPDGLEWTAEKLGFGGAARAVYAAAPLPDYTVPGLENELLVALVAAGVGMALVVGVLSLLKLIARRSDSKGAA